MKKNVLNFLPIPLIFVTTIFFKGLLVFYIPGLLLIFHERFCKYGILMKIAMVLFSSLAFWVIVFWFLKFIPITLTDFVYGVVGAFALSFVLLLRFKGGERLQLKNEDIFVLLVFLGLGLLRLVPFFTTIAPSGADVTMHTYMTQFILNANGIPGGLDPILPGAVFGSYSAGFHVISSIIAFLGGMEAYRAVFFVGSLSSAFFTLALSCLVFNKIKKLWLSIFVAVFISFLTISPQLMAVWGGYPTVFAFAFAVFAFSFADDFFDCKKFVVVDYIILISLVSAIFLSHLIIFSIFAVLFFFVVCLRNLRNYRRILFLGFGFLILVSPYLLTVDLSVSETGRVVAEDWVRYLWNQSRLVLSGFGFSSRVMDLFLTFVYSLGVSIFVFMLLPLTLFKKINGRFWLYGLFFSGVIFLMLIVSRFELFGIFYVFYPERVAMFLILPLALLFGLSVDYLFSKSILKKVFYFVLSVFVCFVFVNALIISNDNYRNHYFLAMNNEISIPEFLFREMFFGNYFIYALGREQNVVTEADLLAFKWIEENTEPDDLFLNSYNDAGLWISAIPFRPIVNVHSNPFMIEEAQAMWLRGDYDYVYAGNKKNVRIDNSPIDTSQYDFDSNLELVFRQENASIYKVLKPL